MAVRLRTGGLEPECVAEAAVLCLVASAEEEKLWLRCGQFIAQQVAASMVYAESFKADTVDSGWYERLQRPLCGLLREVICNPFRTAALDRCLFVPEIVAAAQEIYDANEFGRLADLARALADADCTDAELLQHLRGPGPHVRGCWALDTILQKK